MAPKRKNPDAALSARPSRKKTSPPARVSASHTPEAPLTSTRRPTGSTRASVNYSLIDIEDIDEDRMVIENSDREPMRKTKRTKIATKEDSNRDVFLASDNDQLDAFATPTGLDMSSAIFGTWSIRLYCIPLRCRTAIYQASMSRRWRSSLS
jgi:hypothetical protein